MTDAKSDQGSPPPEGEPPDWVMQTPKPIELPPIDEAEAAVAKSPERGRGGVIAGLVLIVVLVLALVGSSPYWAPGLAALLPWGPRGGGEALAQLGERQGEIARHQAAIDQRLAKLDEQLRAGAASAAAVKDLAQRVTQLEQRPRGGEDGGRLAALQGDLKKLASEHQQTGERLAKLEEAQRNAAAGDRGEQALLLALGQLRSQVQGAQPFAAELGAVEALGRNHPEVKDDLQPLAAAAATGIPTLATLRQRFDRDVVPTLMREAPPENESWGAQIMRRLRSLVNVRRIGDNANGSSDPTESGVARAETALASGDLAGAVKDVEALPGAGAKPAQSWLADAKRRVASEQALARLSDQLTARLTAEERAQSSPAPQGSEH